MNTKDYLKIISCPDCKGKLKEIRQKKQLLGFFCEKCELIYPIKENIPILLPKNARNYNLEYSLVKKIKLKEEIKDSILKTLNLISSFKNHKSWEWEDEEY
jgi:uncharacterized protein